MKPPLYIYSLFLSVILGAGFTSAQSTVSKEKLTLSPHHFVQKFAIPQKDISLDEKQRTMQWTETSKSHTKTKVLVYFDEKLKAHCSYREIELGRDKWSVNREWASSLEAIDPIITEIATAHGVDHTKTKVLNSEGKRAWFGKRKLNGSNQKLQIVYSGQNKEPEKYLLFTAYASSNPDGSYVGHLIWETLDGEKMRKGTYKANDTPYLAPKPRKLDMAGCDFYEMGSIAQLLQWGDHPNSKQTAVFCKHGVVSSIMGQPIKTFEDLQKFYTQTYDITTFDSLTLTLEAYEPNPPYAKKTFRLAVDKERGGLIAERRATVATEEQKAREIEIRKSLEIQLAMKKKTWAEERAAREEERLDELSRKKAKQKRQIALIQEAQDLYLPQLKMLNQEDPLYALSLFKYIYDHHPYLLTLSQRSTLNRLYCVEKNIVLESLPANKDHPAAIGRLNKAGIRLTHLNSFTHYVSVLEGEYVLRTHVSGILICVPIDDASIIVEMLLSKKHSSITFEDIFKISLTGGGVYKGEGRAFRLKPKQVNDYQNPVKIESRGYKEFSHPKRSKRTLTGLAIKFWGGTVVAVNTVGLSVRAMGVDWDEIVEESNRVSLQPKMAQEKPYKGKLGKGEDVKSTHTGKVKGQVYPYKASNGKTYTIEHHNNTGKESLLWRKEGWNVRGTLGSAYLDGGSINKVFKTEQEVRAYIEQCISKSK